MIARFEPVSNQHGYDIRELHMTRKGMMVKRWLRVADYKGVELPTFKPLVACKDKKEFRDQFVCYREVDKKQLAMFGLKN